MMWFVSSIDCALQFAVVLCCYACTNKSIKHLVESDGALTGSIEENLKRVIQTVEKVKVASNEVVDGVTVVRELAEENRMGAGNVVNDMHDLSSDNGVLNERTMSSMEMTSVIDDQMSNVSKLMNQVVSLIEDSVEHANTSSAELAGVVETTNKMATLSSEVETSNKTLADNMQQVCTLMDLMTERIDRAEFTTKEMLSKYEESAKSTINIETVVGHLMEELGVGGFMGVGDVKSGMKIAVKMKNEAASSVDYIGEVVTCNEKKVYVSLDDGGKDVVEKKDKHALCQLRIIVDNVLYCWEDIEIHLSKDGDYGKYMLIVETNPQVFNRRKYPRMPLANPCTIEVNGKAEQYSGRMVNISANGFAFAVKDEIFMTIKGKKITVDVKDFNLLKGESLEGIVIRSSNNDGEYVVGCRMPQDSEVIKDYVSVNYSE